MVDSFLIQSSFCLTLYSPLILPSVSDLHDLYQDIILDHNKRPRHYGALANYTHTAKGYNPLCGDTMDVFLIIKDERIESIHFEAACCAICKASASIMADKLTSKSLVEAEAAFARMSELLTAKDEIDADIAVDGEMAALAGVRNFPARVKCATLPWHTYEAALNGEARAVTE
jgi:nitrogen fixation protein NifU and related proteins